MDPRAIKQELVRVKPQDTDIQWFLQLYPSLFEVALDPTISDKCPGIDALSIWQHRASQIISLSDSGESAESVGKTCSDSDFSDMFNFICNNWTDSGAAVGNALKDLFQKTVSLLAKVRTNDEFQKILQVWTRKVILLPKNVRIVYFGLEHLTKHVGAQFILNEYHNIVDDILPFMHYNGLASAISRALTALLMNLKQSVIDETKWVEFWAVPILKTLKNHSETYSNIQSYLLPALFRTSSQSLPLFMTHVEKDDTFDRTRSLELLADCTKIALQNGLNNNFHTDVSQKPFLEKLVQHKSPAIRTTGLSLIAADVKGSSPIGPHEMQIIRENADSIFNECDSGSRNRILGDFRNIITRLRGYAYASSRKIEKLTEKSEHQKSSLKMQMRYCLKFCEWIFDYSRKLLRPGAPHHSLIAGSQILMILIRSGVDCTIDSRILEKNHVPYPFTVEIFIPETIHLLVGNVMSNYEDVRIISSDILKLCPRSVPFLWSDENISRLTHRAYEMLGGIRGREGDSGARLADLIFHLHGPSGVTYIRELVDFVSKETQQAQKDIFNAVLKHPAHGYFSALRLIFENIDYNEHELSTTTVEEICNSIANLWHVVKPILSHDSPEGNIPEEFEDMYNLNLERTYGLATQVVLSYAWRTVKESSAFLTVLLQKAPDRLISDELILRLSNLILEQLAVVKHRGAFSSVYPSFLACCKRCFQRDSLYNKPFDWLKENLSLIRMKSQHITRRSGGLPFLIVAVLASVPTTKQTSVFSSTLNELLYMAKEPVVVVDGKTDLPQVHAFNCIRVLFTDADLTTISAPFIDVALELAIGYFSDDIWSIRNCSVMLFTALQNRLFRNNSEGKMLSKLFFTKHDKVQPILLNHLRNYVLEKGEKHIEVVYPVLSLLARLEGVASDEGLKCFALLIVECLSSKIWKIREMAARALGSIIIENETEFCCGLLEKCSLSDQNMLHGSCLAMLHILPKTPTNRKSMGDLLNTKVDELFLENKCPETRLTFYRLLVRVLPREKMLEISRNLAYSESRNLSTSKRMCRSEMANYLLHNLSENDAQSLCCSLIDDYAYEVRMTVLDYLLKNKRKISNSDTIHQCLWNLYLNSDIAAIKAKALSVYSLVIRDQPDLLTSSDQMWSILHNDIESDPSESVRYAALESSGTVAGLSSSPEISQQWEKTVRQYSQDTQEFTAREAALKSIASYLKQKKLNANCLITLLDFLSDDDGDLRDLAAQLTCELFNIFDKNSVFCQNVILQQIKKIPNGVDELLSSILEKPLSEQAKAAWDTDSLLFSVEKQNLYRNDVERLEKIITTISESCETLSSVSVRFLDDWLQEGTETFQRFARQNRNFSENYWSETEPIKYFVKQKVQLLMELVQRVKDLRIDQT